MKRLTKINRMDIVHLIETQMNKSVVEQTSRTYAEIEKTLDHSEGMAMVHCVYNKYSNNIIIFVLSLIILFSLSVCCAVFSARGCR